MDRCQLAEQIARIAVGEGLWETGAPDLFVYRFHRPAFRTYTTYRPSLCIIAQGAKRVRVENRVYDYHPQRCLFVGLPRSAEGEVLTASEAKPLLGLVLELELEELNRVAMEIIDAHGPLGGGAEEHSGIVDATLVELPTRPALMDALSRLLEHAADPLRRQVLYKSAVREVLFFLLTGPQGHEVHQLASQGGRFSPIIESVRYIDQHFAEDLRIPTLARRVGMSKSLFYEHFRTVTTLSPLQYLKRVRLQKARILMLSGNNVAQAAFEVGHGSASQFSRDFRDLFGHAPSRLDPGPAPTPIEVGT